MHWKRVFSALFMLLSFSGFDLCVEILTDFFFVEI
jgi:hypothetical protein